MIRPFKPNDALELASLLEWVDNNPDHEVFAPNANDIDDLAIEAEAEAAFVEENALGEIIAYAGLIAYRDIWVLEGPLTQETNPWPVLKATIDYARSNGARIIYAFAGDSNKTTRKALEKIGFDAFQITTFYVLERKKAKLIDINLPENIQRLDHRKVNFLSYRKLFERSSEIWSDRLDWSRQDYKQRFNDENVKVILFGLGEEVVAHCEIEWKEDAAEISYVGVVPTHRGKGIGRLILQEGINTAFSRPETMKLRARAHEFEIEAHELFRKLGFYFERQVIAYTLEINHNN